MTGMIKELIPYYLKKVLISLIAFCMLSSCTGFRFQNVSSWDPNDVSLSKDPFFLDKANIGSDRMLSLLKMKKVTPDNPIVELKEKVQNLQRDLIRAGYDDYSDDSMGMDPLSGSDKTRAILITVFIIGGVAAGVAVTVLLLVM